MRLKLKLKSRQKHPWQWYLYNASLVVLVSCFLALLAVTPIDTIQQSQSTGQFWDVIIILCAYALAAAVAAVMYLVRIWKVRRWLLDIPRQYTVHPSDVPREMARLIKSEKERCAQIVRDTAPKERISHTGLPNPRYTADIDFNAPYEEVVVTASSLVEAKARSLRPSLVRPPGMPMREYIGLLLEARLVEDEGNANAFVTYYERLRFRGSAIGEEDFNNFAGATSQLLYMMRGPDGPVVGGGGLSPLMTGPASRKASTGGETSPGLVALDSAYSFSRTHSRDSSWAMGAQSPYLALAQASSSRPPVSRYTSSILVPISTLSPQQTQQTTGSVPEEVLSDAASNASIPSNSSVIVRRR